MRRAAAVAGPVDEPPRCLRVRHPAVWSLAPGDPLAGARFRAAATSWRAQARAAGMSNADVWAALPAARFLQQHDEHQLNYMLWPLDLTTADLETLAGEAVAAFAFVFDPMWTPGGDPDAAWHLVDVRARLGEQGL